MNGQINCCNSHPVEYYTAGKNREVDIVSHCVVFKSVNSGIILFVFEKNSSVLKKMENLCCDFNMLKSFYFTYKNSFSKGRMPLAMS